MEEMGVTSEEAGELGDVDRGLALSRSMYNRGLVVI